VYNAWTVKHKPQTLSEIVGNEEAIRKLTSWINSWSKAVPKKRAAFLYGPPGIGKTVAVEALANDLKMELVEKNASDHRTAEAVQRFAGLASQYELFPVANESYCWTNWMESQGQRIGAEFERSLKLLKRRVFQLC
jgi:DNA polymerase III delta prime subunit